MKHRRLSLVVSVLTVAVLAAPAGADETVVLAGRYAVKGDGEVNTYILDTGSTIVIVDAQRQLSLATDVVDVVGDRAERVAAILITYPLPDHVTGIDVLREAFGVPVYGSQATADELASDSRGHLAENREMFPDDTPANAPTIDRIVRDGDVIPVGEFSFEVVELGPGESVGATLYYEPSRRMLIAGDLFAVGRTPYLVDGHVLEWIRQLDVVVTRFGPDVTVYPAHGEPGPLGELASAQKDYLETFVTLVREARRDGVVDYRESEAIVEEMEVRYPGYTSVAPMHASELLHLNIEAVARELSRGN
jgi:glyoxylase-like metal-dependent hydrolase (beta-lactamase superfamily II)